jgi:hypothetical protein
MQLEIINFPPGAETAFQQAHHRREWRKASEAAARRRAQARLRLQEQEEDAHAIGDLMVEHMKWQRAQVMRSAHEVRHVHARDACISGAL